MVVRDQGRAATGAGSRGYLDSATRDASVALLVFVSRGLECALREVARPLL